MLTALQCSTHCGTALQINSLLGSYLTPSLPPSHPLSFFYNFFTRQKSLSQSFPFLTRNNPSIFSHIPHLLTILLCLCSSYLHFPVAWTLCAFLTHLIYPHLLSPQPAVTPAFCACYICSHSIFLSLLSLFFRNLLPAWTSSSFTLCSF